MTNENGRRDSGCPQTESMDYEDAANKLIKYSRALAKGSLSTAYGMSMGEAPVLEYLCRCDEGLNPSDLANRLGYTRSRMTRILDSLAAKGFVERTADERDRRKVVVSATEKGLAHAKEVRSEGAGDLAGSLSELGEHDTRELLRVLRRAYSITYDREGILDDEE